MMKIIKSKFPLFQKNFSFLLKNVRNNSIVTSPDNHQKQDKDIRVTSEFKIRPDDIEDYLLIGAEIFKNAFKESALISEKETDITKRTELFMKEINEKPEVYGVTNFKFKFPEPNPK